MLVLELSTQPRSCRRSHWARLWRKTRGQCAAVWCLLSAGRGSGWLQQPCSVSHVCHHNIPHGACPPAPLGTAGDPDWLRLLEWNKILNGMLKCWKFLIIIISQIIKVLLSKEVWLQIYQQTWGGGGRQQISSLRVSFATDSQGTIHINSPLSNIDVTNTNTFIYSTIYSNEALFLYS